MNLMSTLSMFDITNYIGFALYALTLLYGLLAYNYHVGPMVITAYLVIAITIYNLATYLWFKKTPSLMGIIVGGKRAFCAMVWGTITHLAIAAMLFFLYRGM